MHKYHSVYTPFVHGGRKFSKMLKIVVVQIGSLKELVALKY